MLVLGLVSLFDLLFSALPFGTSFENMGHEVSLLVDFGFVIELRCHRRLLKLLFQILHDFEALLFILEVLPFNLFLASFKRLGGLV